MNNLSNVLDVIVICYDPYIDAIELSPFFFEKNWENCTANVVYVTSNIKQVGKYKTITTNGDLTYTGRLRAGLKECSSKYVLLLLDDYLIDQKIDESLLMSDISFMNENDIKYCNLYNMFVKPKGKKLNKHFIEITPKMHYRINLQPSIFERDYLDGLLKEKINTAWDVELALMKPNYKFCKAIYANNKSFRVTNYIDKGYITPKAVRLLKKYGKWKKQRKVMPFYKVILKKLSIYASITLPKKLKARLKKGPIYK